MDRQKGRDLHPVCSKRQLRALLGHIAASHSALHDKINRGGEEEGAERWKVDDLAGMMPRSCTVEPIYETSCSHSESDGVKSHVAQSPAAMAPTGSVIIKKGPSSHAKLIEAAENCNAVDPAMVPRKLGSAINKRSSQSASPPLPDAKKRHHHPSGGSQAACINGAKKFKQQLKSVAFTKDEEEVAETLSTLASTALVVNKAMGREDGGMSQGEYKAKATSISAVETPREDVKTLLSCSSIQTTNLSLGVKQTEKDGPSVLEQSITVNGSQNFKQEKNGVTQYAAERRALLYSNEHKDRTTLEDEMKSLKPKEASPQLYYANGVHLPTQSDGLPQWNPENRLWLQGFIAEEQKLQHINKQPDSITCACRQDKTTLGPCGLPNGVQSYLKMSASSTTAVWPDIATTTASPSSIKKIHPIEKYPPFSVNKKLPWKRPVTHVQINHLIENHQNGEKGCQLPLRSTQLEVRESSNSVAHMANETVAPSNGLTSMASSATDTIVESNVHESRIIMIQDRKLLEAQQAATFSGPYPQTKQSAGQFPAPSWIQHHTIMPFPFFHGSYTAAYSNHLSASANQQAQMQLPQYLNSSLYVPHMLQLRVTANHQHHQARHVHTAHYMPPSPSTPKWSIRRPHNSPLHPYGQASYVAPEFSGMTYHRPSHQLQLLSTSSLWPSPTSRVNVQQH